MSGNWECPDELFDHLNEEFGFTLDACADPGNAKCDIFYNERALDKDWPGVVWCNPPFSRNISFWIQKARWEARKGSTVVCLLPARTDTIWWHEEVMGKASEVRFIRGRLSFLRVETPMFFQVDRHSRRSKRGRAPFPVAIVVFYPKVQKTVYSSLNLSNQR